MLPLNHLTLYFSYTGRAQKASSCQEIYETGHTDPGFYMLDPDGILGSASASLKQCTGGDNY